MPNAFLAARLTAQQIAHPAFATPRDLVRWLGAMQAQDYAGAKWALGLRLAGDDVTEGAIERAIADGVILRTHVMRWTWQLVLPEDVRWMLKLVAPRLIARAARRHRELELDAATFRKSNDVIEKAVRDGGHWTRHELSAHLGRAGISTAKERLSHILGRAELDALICSGARRGKQFTYARLDDRAGRTSGSSREISALPRDEALAELARRYFRSRGPATLADYTWWSGLTTSDARAGLEAIRSTLTSESRDGDTYFHSDERAPSGAGVRTRAASRKSAAQTCHFLPAFDELLVAYRKRDAFLDPVHAKRINAGGGMLSPSVILDGRVIGTWRRELHRSAVAIEVDLFARPTREERNAIGLAAGRYGAFLGLEVEISL